MRSRVLAFWGLVCLFGHLANSPAEAQGKPSTKPATQAAKPAADASPEQRAREAFERGRIHYDNGDFARAASAFEEAYSLSGREGLLYNLYLAYRDANQQEKAAEALRNYLAKVEVIENRAQLEARLKALEAGIAQRKSDEAREAQARELAAQQEAEQAKARAAQEAAAQKSAPAPAPAEQKKWWLTPVIVMSAGGALMAGSLATGLMANSKSQELEDKCTDGVCPPELKDTADTGKTLAVVTDVLLFSGIATAAVGGVLLLLKRPKAKADAENTTRASVSCSHAGCAGKVSWRF